MHEVSCRQHALVALLKACSNKKDLQRGSKIHAHILRLGLLERDIFAGTTLVSMYCKCGSLVRAQQVFDDLPDRNVVSWTALIAGLTQHSLHEQAVSCFEQMQIEGVSPNAITFVCVLKSCCHTIAVEKGHVIHGQIIRGKLETNIVVATALVDMYSKCGCLVNAQDVFDNILDRDVPLWNVLIAGYAQYKHGEKVLKCLKQMQFEGLCPSEITFVCILKACGCIGAAGEGQKLHMRVVAVGFLENNIVGTALVDMYAKCGFLARAQEEFDKLSSQNVISWNALIAGFSQHGYNQEALNCFERMQFEGISPNEGYIQHGYGEEALQSFERMQSEGISLDAVTFVSILKACGSIGAIEKGQEIHGQIVSDCLMEGDIAVGTALVDMYAKCGLLAKAQQVFDKLLFRNVVSWNVLLAGYSLLGEVAYVFHTFENMIGEGVGPDIVTFIILLNACSHTGALDKGQMCFETMMTRFSIFPTIEHYTCMVDLFGRAGLIDMAIAALRAMPFLANLCIWHIVLGFCRKWRNLELARLAFEHAVQLEEKNSAAYVCMVNIYLDVGRQEDAVRVEALRVEKQAWVEPTNFWRSTVFL